MFYNCRQVIGFYKTAVLVGWITHLNVISLFKLFQLCDTLRSVVYHLHLLSLTSVDSCCRALMMARQKLLSCMLDSISLSVSPMSSWSRSTNVLKGRPLDLFPCVGLHVTRSDTALPLARLQCPANWSLLFCDLCSDLWNVIIQFSICHVQLPTDI